MFKPTSSFWALYKDGVKDSLRSFSLNDAESRITRFGKNLKNVVREGRTWVTPDWEGVDFSGDFVEAGSSTGGSAGGSGCRPVLENLEMASDAAVLQLQCFDSVPGRASARVFCAWEKGEAVLNLVHNAVFDCCCNGSGTPIAVDLVIAALQSAAHQFVSSRYGTSREIPIHHRRCMFLTNLDDGRTKYSRSTMLQKRLPSIHGLPGHGLSWDVDRLLAMWIGILTTEYRVTCLTFGKHGLAFASTLVQYMGLELARAMSRGEMHFTTNGL